MKKIIFFICFFIIMLPWTSTFGKSDISFENEQNQFKINSFLKSSKEFGGEFLDNINIDEVLNNVIEGKVDNSSLLKGFLKIISNNIPKVLKTIGSILVIIVIHSVLKSISESLENDSIERLVYYVQYILIVTIIMSNFLEIVDSIKDTCTNLIDYTNILIPLLVSLMVYTGSIVTSSLLEPIVIFTINFISNIIQNILIPTTMVFSSLIIISKISDRVQIESLTKMFKSGITWFLGIILTIFVGVVSLEGTMTSSVDGVTAKTTKAIVSSAVPVVGKILSDSVDTVLGAGIVLKNAVGFIGVLVIIGICIMPIIELFTITVSYKLLSAIIEPIADKKIVELLNQIADIYKIFIAILFSLSIMLIIRYGFILKNIK